MDNLHNLRPNGERRIEILLATGDNGQAAMRLRPIALTRLEQVAAEGISAGAGFGRKSL